MKNHIIHFIPHPPKPDKGYTHIDCIEESSRLPEKDAISMRVKCGIVYIDRKIGKWTDYVPDRCNTHPQAQELIRNKAAALNAGKPLNEGGDPSAKETWQHDCGLIEQNGTKFKDILRIGGFRPLHMD